MSAKGKRPSGAMVVAVVALVVALVGTGVAAVGLSRHQKSQVRGISKVQTGKRVKKVFKRVAVDDNKLVATVAGFKLRLGCTQTSVYPYLNPPPNVPIDGASMVYHDIFDNDPAYIRLNVYSQGGRLDLTDSGGLEQSVSSFAITTKGGRVVSGTLGYDLPGGGGIFENDDDHCVVYGHLFVN